MYVLNFDILKWYCAINRFPPFALNIESFRTIHIIVCQWFSTLQHSRITWGAFEKYQYLDLKSSDSDLIWLGWGLNLRSF